MRQIVPLVVVAAAALFVGFAIPGSPLTRGLVSLISGAMDQGPAAAPSPPSAVGPSQTSQTLRAAVAAMVSPQRTYGEYRHLFEAIAGSMDLSLEFVQRRTYAEINELLASGSIDLAWICTGAVPDLERRGGAEIVACPVVNGRRRYRSNLIVPEESVVDSPRDLKGRRMAFTDPLSLTGRWVVVDWLSDAGHDPAAFFGSTFYTHGHDLSLQAVRRGLADAASVDSLVWDYLQQREPSSVTGLRVAWRSRSFPNPPIALSRQAAARFDGRLRSALLRLGESSSARASLEKIGVQRIIPVQPADYRGLERIVPAE